jgi:hypothetical protein
MLRQRRPPPTRRTQPDDGAPALAPDEPAAPTMCEGSADYLQLASSRARYWMCV